MKIFSNKLFVAVLVVSNVASASYIVNNWNSLNPSPAIHKVEKAKEKKKDPGLERYRKAVVREAVAQRSEEIQKCYEDFLASDYKSIDQGSIVINWHVGTEGEVASVSLVDSDFKNDDLTQCVFGQVQSLRFDPPPSNQEVLVLHKFNFRKKTPDQITFQ